MRLALTIFFSAALIFAGVFFLKNSTPPETEVSRTNPVASSIEPYSIETAKRTDPIGSSNEPYPIVKAVEMPVVATGFVNVVSGNVSTVMVNEVHGTVVSPEPAPSSEPSEWNAALMDLTSLNSELASVEKMATRSGLLPEAAEIEAAFASLNSELDALKSKRLSDDERLQIRESLQNSAAELFGRIGDGLNARQGNHLVDLANTELARVMESLQGF